MPTEDKDAHVDEELELYNFQAPAARTENPVAMVSTWLLHGYPRGTTGDRGAGEEGKGGRVKRLSVVKCPCMQNTWSEHVGVRACNT